MKKFFKHPIVVILIVSFAGAIFGTSIFIWDKNKRAEESLKIQETIRESDVDDATKNWNKYNTNYGFAFKHEPDVEVRKETAGEWWEIRQRSSEDIIEKPDFLEKYYLGYFSVADIYEKNQDLESFSKDRRQTIYPPRSIQKIMINNFPAIEEVNNDGLITYTVDVGDNFLTTGFLEIPETKDIELINKYILKLLESIETL